MKKSILSAVLLTFFAATLITSCDQVEKTPIGDDSTYFTELSKGIFSRPIDMNVYTEHIVKCTGDESVTHVSHFPQTIDKEIEGKCINFYISVF